MKQRLDVILSMTVDLDSVGPVSEFEKKLSRNLVFAARELYEPNGKMAYPCTGVWVVDLEWGDPV